jgi:hypothetical protein
MAKRPPTSRSQADDTAVPGAPKPPHARAAKASAPTPPGAPVPPDPQAIRASATDQRPIDLDPGPRPEALGSQVSTSSRSSRSTSMASEPSEEDIRMRAYHRYLERGGGQGQEFDDWVEAEKELKTGR